jgi:hypothetical protein
MIPIHGEEVTHPAEIVDCNRFYVTYRNGSMVTSTPLRRIEISFDAANTRLKLEEFHE